MMLTVQRGLALVLTAVGVAVLVESAAVGGGSVGYLLGAALVALGLLRLRMARR